MKREITLDELRAEYERLGLTKQDNGLTVAEIGELWGLGCGAVRDRLRAAKKAGVLRVGRKRAECINGNAAWAPCYWFEFPKSKSKRK